MATPRHALILAAGLGTRLRPLTLVRAKPAIPLGGEPMIRHIGRWLVSQGVTDLVVNLHYLPSTLTAALGDGSDLGARVRYSWEQPAVLGSAGGPRQALPIIGAHTFFIVNGDTMTEVDLDRLAGAHAASGALVTLALIPNREPDRYGGVVLDEQSWYAGTVGRGPRAERSLHFVGVQVASADAFASLPQGQPIKSIGEAYEGLIRSRPGSIRGFVTDAPFWDVGTVADYIRTARALAGARGGSPWSRPARIDPTARVAGSILWDEVEVGPHADVEDCILTDGVRVPAGGTYRRMILIKGLDGMPVATPFPSERA